MRRKLFGVLLIVILLAVGAKFITSPEKNPSGVGVNFVEYKPLTPLKNPDLGQLQNYVDNVSEAVMKNEWNVATRAVKNLADTWQKIQVTQTYQLEIEQNISQAIQNLQLNIWGENPQESLLAAQKLTELIGQLNM